MKYRIEFTDGRCCNIANDRNDLIRRLQGLKNGVVSDVRKIYKSGVSDSVIEKYEQYIKR